MSQTNNSSSITRSNVNFSIGQVSADKAFSPVNSTVTISVPISYSNTRASPFDIQGVLNLQGTDGTILNENIQIGYTSSQTSKIITFIVSSDTVGPVTYTAKVYIDIGSLTSNTVTVGYVQDSTSQNPTSQNSTSQNPTSQNSTSQNPTSQNPIRLSSTGCPSPCPVCPTCPQPVCPKPSCPSCPTCPICPVCMPQNSTSLTSSASPNNTSSIINYTPITLIGVLIIILLLCISLYKISKISKVEK
jgi:hypothetical protein